MSRFRRNVKILKRGVEQDSEAVSRLNEKECRDRLEKCVAWAGGSVTQGAN